MFHLPADTVPFGREWDWCSGTRTKASRVHPIVNPVRCACSSTRPLRGRSRQCQHPPPRARRIRISVALGPPRRRQPARTSRRWQKSRSLRTYEIAGRDWRSVVIGSRSQFRTFPAGAEFWISLLIHRVKLYYNVIKLSKFLFMEGIVYISIRH